MFNMRTKKMVNIVAKAEFSKNVEEFFSEQGYNVDNIKNGKDEVDQSVCRKLIVEMFYKPFAKPFLDEEFDDNFGAPFDREVTVKGVFYKLDLQKTIRYFCRLCGVEFSAAVETFAQQNSKDDVNKILSELCAILELGQEDDSYAIYEFELSTMASFLCYAQYSEYNLCIKNVFILLRQMLKR